MKRALGLTAACLALTACTPDVEVLLVWAQRYRDQAAAEGLPCPEYADALAWRGLPQHFHYVIQRESQCHPGAVNSSSGALGLTQVMPFWLRALCPMGIACTEADLLDVEANLDAAAVIYREQGPDAWSQTWGP